jgi:hypothetical protein
MADNAPILVIVPPRTAAKREVEEDWGPVGGPSTLAPGHPQLLEGVSRAAGCCARVFFDREATSVPPDSGRTSPQPPARGRSGRYFRSVFDQPQGVSTKPLILWRSLGDSNPCFRRERARLTLFDCARRTRSNIFSTSRLACASFCASRARSTTFVLGPCWESKKDSSRSRPQDWPWRSRRVPSRCLPRVHPPAQFPRACERRP